MKCKYCKMNRLDEFGFCENCLQSNPKEEVKRTGQQNRSLHLYFTQIAEALNEAGLDMRATLKPEIEIPWSGKTVKEYMWKPVQKIQLEKESTTDLTTKEIDQVWEVFNRHIAKLGIYVPFPSLETQLLDEVVKSEQA